MESYEDIQNYINKLDENQIKQLYNLNHEGLKPHIIQFNQLIEYFNFKSKIKSQLSNPNNKGEVLNEIYLIDKRWLKKWKKHVGYNVIKKFYNDNIKKNELNKYDYDFIEPIINNNTQNLLTPLDNFNIYDNKGAINPLDNFNIYDNKGAINIYSEFIIVNKKCFELFSLGSKISNFQLLIKNYQMTIYFDKLLLKIDEINYLLKFKEQQKKFELIINLIKGKSDFNGFLNEIVNTDINIWIKNLGFDLYSEEAKKLERFNIIILNKTLISKKFGNVFDKENNMNEAILNVTYNLPNEMKRKIIMDKQNLQTQKLDKASFGALVPNISMTKISQTKKVINKNNNEKFSDQSNNNRKNKNEKGVGNFLTEIKK